MDYSAYQKHAPVLPTVVVRGHDLHLWFVIITLFCLMGIGAYFIVVALERELDPHQAVKTLRVVDSMQLGEGGSLTNVRHGSVSVQATQNATHKITPVVFAYPMEVKPNVVVTPVVPADDDYTDLQFVVTDITPNGFHILSRASAFPTTFTYSWIAVL